MHIPRGEVHPSYPGPDPYKVYVKPAETITHELEGCYSYPRIIFFEVSGVLQKGEACMSQKVYVLDKNKNPLMPTTRFGHVRILLKQNKARVVSNKPFTIQLLYDV